MVPGEGVELASIKFVNSSDRTYFVVEESKPNYVPTSSKMTAGLKDQGVKCVTPNPNQSNRDLTIPMILTVKDVWGKSMDVKFNLKVTK